MVTAGREDSNGAGATTDVDNNSVQDSGAGYVFTFDGSTWAQMGYLKGAVADTDDRLGIVAAISGASLVFSGNLEDSNATGVGGDFTDNSATSAGAAFLFQ